MKKQRKGKEKKRKEKAEKKNQTFLYV